MEEKNREKRGKIVMEEKIEKKKGKKILIYL